VGENACTGAGGLNGIAIIGNSSCIGGDACAFAGNTNGYFVAGDNSCSGNFSCSNGGYKSSLKIGSNSCNQMHSCSFENQTTSDRIDKWVLIGDGSCNGAQACKFDPYNTTVVRIGDGSCNGSDACSCLEDGDVVPDNACNSTGADQCCVNMTTRGSMHLEWNMCKSFSGCSGVPYIPPPTMDPILDLNEYDITDPTCYGNITSSFEESVTCSMTKFAGTNVSLEFLEGNCTGATIGNITEDVMNESTITGTILPDFNITGAGNETYSFCLVAKSFFASEIITEVKTLGTVMYYYTASGNFTLNVTTEALTVGEVSADATAEEVTLEVYQCLDDGSVDQNTPVAYQQGSTLSVCLHSNQPSLVLLTGVDMVISPFSSGFSPSLIVDDDVPVKTALTLVTPLSDQTIIQIKTVLISLFFLDPKNKILVQGSARFIYKTRKERILRIMQSADEVGSSTFDLVVDLEPNESGIYDVSSPSSSIFLSMFIMPLLPLLFSLS